MWVFISVKYTPFPLTLSLQFLPAAKISLLFKPCSCYEPEIHPATPQQLLHEEDFDFDFALTVTTNAEAFANQWRFYTEFPPPPLWLPSPPA